MSREERQQSVGVGDARKLDAMANTKTNRLFRLNIKTVSLLLLAINKCVSAESEQNMQDDLDSSLSSIFPEFNTTEEVELRPFGRMFTNGTFRTGYKLWDGILNQCTVNPSIRCLQKNVYSYLEDSVGFEGDVKVVSGVCFKKNAVELNKYSKEASLLYLKGSAPDVREEESRAMEEDNEITDDDGQSESPLEEVTDSLYDRSAKFLMTHDLSLTLPETFFHGATLRLSPRALTGTGALVHVDLQPKEEEMGDGRIFFRKIKKYFQKKLFLAALAVILVIKLIKLKIFFVLPLIIGVGAAQKLMIKLMLFIFPAMGHIFKLCGWYHQNYHSTKYHHHHHLISHHHHKQVPPIHPGVHVPHAVYGPPGHSAGGHISVQTEGGPTYEHYPQDWELSGPGLGSEYLAAGVNRIADFKPHVDDINDINAWGLGLPPGSAEAPGPVYNPYSGQQSQAPNIAPAGSIAYPKAQIGMHIGRPVGPPIGGQPIRVRRPAGKEVHLNAEKQALLRAAALAARAPPSPVRDEVLRVSAAQLAEAARTQAEKRLVQHQQKILAATDPDTILADKFYGVLMERVERTLSQLGAKDQGCRERAVCSLYRDPINHAPHSNLVSAELSKEASELAPPGESKYARLYYNYVQAARDGQDQKDCLTLYPHCEIYFHKR